MFQSCNISKFAYACISLNLDSWLHNHRSPEAENMQSFP